jgi:hypothetical protein
METPWFGIHFLPAESSNSVSSYWDSGYEIYREVSVGYSYAQQFEVTREATSAGLDSLCRKSILNHIESLEKCQVIKPYTEMTTRNWNEDDHELALTPLVKENMGLAVAGTVNLQDPPEEHGERSTFILPSFTTHRDEWISAIYDLWSSMDSVLFPPRGTVHDPIWMTPKQLEAHTALLAHKKKSENVIKHLREEEDSLAARYKNVDSNHKIGMQALLHANGSELESSVEGALKIIGFNVTKSDDDPRNKDAKQEDLQVRSGLDSNWAAIVEIKGYSKSPGKTNITRQIDDAAAVFRMREKVAPSARWLVINGEFSQKVVSLRKEPLSGRPDKVAEFSEVGGLVIPTPVLFRYWRDIETGVSSANDVMMLLMKSTGVLKYTFLQVARST